MKKLTNDEVITKAKEWADAWTSKKPASMDVVLSGLTVADRKKVILCGQRVVGGLTLKVSETTGEEPTKRITTGKGDNHDQEKKQRRQQGSTGASPKATKGKVSVGATASTKESGKRRKSAHGKK